jgi:hypothetical protein
VYPGVGASNQGGAALEREERVVSSTDMKILYRQEDLGGAATDTGGFRGGAHRDPLRENTASRRAAVLGNGHEFL